MPLSEEQIKMAKETAESYMTTMSKKKSLIVANNQLNDASESMVRAFDEYQSKRNDVEYYKEIINQLNSK